MQITLSNCLATNNPELISEWHPTKNGDSTPYDVTYGSNKLVWWQCAEGHEWPTTIVNRTKNNTNCPYCTGQLPTKENNLLVHNISLCEEWDYENNDKRPEDYTPFSGVKVAWKCRECDNKWKATIANRNKSRGCPQCSESKGEKECKRVFDLRNLYYIPQKEFDELLGLGGGNLSYDFYLVNYNLLIEYQGEYHDGKAGNQSSEDLIKQQEHDRRKKEYAEKHNIKLLEIWYWDFDKIEEILLEELNINKIGGICAK